MRCGGTPPRVCPALCPEPPGIGSRLPHDPAYDKSFCLPFFLVFFLVFFLIVCLSVFLSFWFSLFLSVFLSFWFLSFFLSFWFSLIVINIDSTPKSNKPKVSVSLWFIRSFWLSSWCSSHGRMWTRQSRSDANEVMDLRLRERGWPQSASTQSLIRFDRGENAEQTPCRPRCRERTRHTAYFGFPGSNFWQTSC